MLQETHGIDFYNILFNVRYRSTAAQSKRFDFLNPRTTAFEVMVKRKRLDVDDEDEDYGDKLTNLMRNKVHPALGISSEVVWGSQAGAVFDTLAGDFMKPVVNFVEDLLNNSTVKVVVYSGQLDLICATPGTVQWINNMNRWSAIEEYKKASRDGIGVNNVLEGYVRKYDNFSMYWVR